MARHTRSATTPAPMAMDEEATKFILYLQQALKDPDTIKILKQTMEPIQLINNIKELSKKVDSLEKKIESKDQHIKHLEEKIKSIEIKQDAQDQFTRRDTLRINGLAESKDENIEREVLHVFNDTMSVHPPLKPEDIVRVHRIGRVDNNKTRQVIVKLASYGKKEIVFKNKRSLAKTSLSVNEDLTQTRAKLLYRAREARRNGIITSAWSSDGRIVVKMNNNLIKSAVTSDELDNIIGPSPTKTS